MEDENAKDKLAGIVRPPQNIAPNAASLMGRGLRTLSGWDTNRLIEVGKTLTSCLQLDELLRRIMESIDEWFHPTEWSMLLVDESTNELYFELAVGNGAQALRDVRVKMGQGIAGWVADHCESIVIPDTRNDQRFFSKNGEKTGTDAKSIMAVPLVRGSSCLGVIHLAYELGGGDLSQTNLSLLEGVANFAAIALENARHVKRIHELTITDDCTGLFNFRHMDFILETEICRSQRYGYEFALIFFDADPMKELTSSLSYFALNNLLAEIGQAVKTSLRRIDFAFYYKEREFAVVLPQGSKETASNIARQMHKLFRETIWLAQENDGLWLKVSFGVAAFPTDAKTKVDLIHRADEAMYLVKNSGGDGVAVANGGILQALE